MIPTCSECGNRVFEICVSCGQTAMHTEQDMEQVLTEAQAEKILEAIKTEAIQDEIAYEMARPRISPELDLFDLQNGLGW